MTTKSFKQFQEEIKNKAILIANRGIPARRISRAIAEISGIAVITVTDVDKTSPVATGAQELLLLGEDPTSYLDLDLIIKKAVDRGIVGIHPGWGFGAEDYSFPSKCQKAGITFIGPDPEAMRLLGNKVEVRKLADKLQIPVVPGSMGAVTIDEAYKTAKEIGFPVMLKSEGGGGGRGIYEIYNEADLKSSFNKASAFAQASFGNPRLFVERLLTSVRHIEIQVIADKYGNVFAFDERDCTVQRNHQKLIEITPSPWKGMTEKLRNKLKEYSRKLITEVGYHSLATVEFLIDQDGSPYLIEVNTRLQVEHGITECRYGIDLVEEQIAVSFGSTLRLNEENTKPHQHAIQVRVNCEDPKDNFSPNAGRITRYISPGGQGVRNDSCITAGYNFPSQYDSAALLLITYGNSWQKAVRLMNRALRECMINGVKTTLAFHRQVVKHPDFISGDYNTKFIEKNPELMTYIDRPPEPLRLSRLISDISVKGYNEYIQLDRYRGRTDKRLGKFQLAKPVLADTNFISSYPKKDRAATLDFIRESDYIHFTDTTARDQTQSNSGNRFRLAEDKIIGPYLDKCGFFSLENGGGAHFHVAMLANMTYPFEEARQWNEFAPQTMKQILVRSTNLLGYKPQPKNLMYKTGELICEHYDIIRCFDFLNHIENMKPIAKVVMNSTKNIFEPAISISWAKGFDVKHYLDVTKEILNMTSAVSGISEEEVSKIIILGLKDMAGVCPPKFIKQLVETLRKTFPNLVLHYHRHCTDGLFIPAVGAAAQAGAHIIDTAIGASVRWYGQGDILATASYMENELNLKTNLDKKIIGSCNFVLKQIMPYYDKYTAPFFQGTDFEVIEHGMPGGATSSSQEGAMQQGYIHLLPYMLNFLKGFRKIVRYHDVTPGSQITWNLSFLTTVGAYKRGGEARVQKLLKTLEKVTTLQEDELSTEIKKARLELYSYSNDAFKDLIIGKFGKLPLGFPPNWVYESAFNENFKTAIKNRTEESPLLTLKDIDFDNELEIMTTQIGHKPTNEELILFLNHPVDAIKTIKFREKFGNPNQIPLDVWFEGVEKGEAVSFDDSTGKPHKIRILEFSEPDEDGNSVVRYLLDSEIFNYQVKVNEATNTGTSTLEMADPSNLYHIASPSNGDLWIMCVEKGDILKKGTELFNISIMKQEKSVTAPMDSRVKRVLKTANYQETKKMVPVRDGELLVELEPYK